MRKLIITLSAVLMALINHCQVFTYHSDTSWIYEYGKKENFEQLLIRGLPYPKTVVPVTTNYVFDTRASTLTVKRSGFEDHVYRIQNVEKRFKSRRLLKCQVILDKKKMGEVLIRRDMRTKKIILRFDYPNTRKSKQCIADFNGNYDIQ